MRRMRCEPAKVFRFALCETCMAALPSSLPRFPIIASLEPAGSSSRRALLCDFSCFRRFSLYSPRAAIRTTKVRLAKSKQIPSFLLSRSAERSSYRCFQAYDPSAGALIARCTTHPLSSSKAPSRKAWQANICTSRFMFTLIF